SPEQAGPLYSEVRGFDRVLFIHTRTSGHRGPAWVHTHTVRNSACSLILPTSVPIEQLVNFTSYCGWASSHSLICRSMCSIASRRSFETNVLAWMAPCLVTLGERLHLSSCLEP